MANIRPPSAIDKEIENLELRIGTEKNLDRKHTLERRLKELKLRLMKSRKEVSRDASTDRKDKRIQEQEVSKVDKLKNWRREFKEKGIYYKKGRNITDNDLMKVVDGNPNAIRRKDNTLLDRGLRE